ncbi:MAG: hypothetical protein RMM98_04765 [Acidobacteriota bacterium]|nr:hypothetical protein [Blastocatellia bacterium]MDW8238904.1 hypothetical protein [Acidobacteriota bacterium]
MNEAYQPDDDPPPILGTWARVYAAALIFLFVIIGVLYWLTERYAEAAR